MIPDFRALERLAAGALSQTATDLVRSCAGWDTRDGGGWLRLGDWWIMPPDRRAPVILARPELSPRRFLAESGGGRITDELLIETGWGLTASCTVERAARQVGNTRHGYVAVAVPREFAIQMLVPRP